MPFEIRFNRKTKNKNFWMFHYMFFVAGRFNFYMTSQTQNAATERSISRLPPSAEWPSVRGATYRIN